MMIDVEYIFEKPIKGFSKSYGIYRRKGVSIIPMVYFRKPKWLTDEEFEEFIKSIGFTITQKEK